ncbi:unnamed protein product [Rotaria sp. Silwood2]|nr:unnamed protein product [Rotaria sp. Silwood2]CAF4404899.1 unnamed protein product [Rotaria sp. Silwood2]
MLKKYSSWASMQSSPSVITDVTMIKSVLVKGDEQEQQSSKNFEEIEASSHMHINDDIQSSSAPISISSSTTNEPNKVCSIEKPSKVSSSTMKRNSKHKYRHYHHRNRHHNHQQRAKSVGQQPKLLSPSKFTIKNSKHVDQNQQPKIIYPRVSNNTDHSIDMNGLVKFSRETDNKTASIDDQKAPSVVNRDVDIQRSIVSKSICQSVLPNKDQEKKTSRGNIPLKTIENKIVSQRVAPTNETQVGNYCPMCCTQSTPSYINPCCVEPTERIYVDDSCCIPSTTINCGASNSCVIPQYDPIVCVPQQQHQQQQIIICTDPMQQTLSQQQYVCLENTPQISFCTPLSANSSPQSLICVPQTPCQSTSSIVIQQQPQIQVLPLQIISSSQTPAAQCMQICPNTPQALQTQPTIQISTPNVTVTPQVLYQRPYDTVVLPAQKQQLVCATPPAVALSRPSYAPVCVAPAPRPSGPTMFRNALIRTVAQKSGLQIAVCAPAQQSMVCRPAQQSMVCTPAQQPMVCTPASQPMICAPAPPPPQMVCAPASPPMVCTAR